MAGSSCDLFNAHYDEYGFQPIVVFDVGQLHPRRSSSRQTAWQQEEVQRSFLRRLLRAIHANWPKAEIPAAMPTVIVAVPEVLD